MKQNFRGWTSVYSFTFRQSTKGIGFKLITVLISLIIIGLIVTVNILQAKPDTKEEVKTSPIKTVYILDQSGLSPTSFKDLNPELAKKKYKNIKYVAASVSSRAEVIKTASKDSKHTIAVIITKIKKGFQLEAAIPSNSSITKDQAGDLLDRMQIAFESSKLMQSGLTAEQLTTVLTPDATSYSNIGESNNEMVYAIKLIAPMLFCLMIYFMLFIYGADISKSIANEKTSKLMETLLTSVHPYALITGKILAVTSIAFLQFIIWIVSGFVGLYGGNAIARTIYPDYHNSIITIFNFIKDNFGKTALSPAAILLAVLFFCIGLLFYFVLAGISGCMVSKPEDTASTQQLFMLPVIISFMVAYFAPLNENHTLMNAVRFIPFTAPFSVPADLLTGTLGLGQGCLALAVLAVFTFLLVILSGRLYKGLILYSGQKVSLKMIGNVLKNNN